MKTDLEREFDFGDIGEINAATSEYVQQLSSLELEKRLDSVMVSKFGDVTSAESAGRMLREHGLVVFPEVVSEAICDAAEQAITELTDRFSSTVEPFVEDDSVLFQLGSAKLKGYYKLSHYDKTVVTVRQGQDQGMIDIFNCDYLLANELTPMRSVFEDAYVFDVIGSVDLKPHNLNAYVNRQVTKTRGFHVDSYSEHLKAFVYITDVSSLEDGPYTYVKGSHRVNGYRRANQSLCGGLTPATETPVVDPLAIIPVVAPRGSLVISDQAGSHRGWPQAPESMRMAAVMKYA